MFKSLESSPRNLLPENVLRDLGMQRRRSLGLVLPASPRGATMGYFQRPMTPTQYPAAQFQMMSPRHQLMSPTNHTAFAWPSTYGKVEAPRREATAFIAPGSPAWRPARDAAPFQYPSSEDLYNVEETPKFGKWLRDMPPTPRQKTASRQTRARQASQLAAQMQPLPARRRQGVEPAPKLGPERYKSLRVDGQRGRTNNSAMGWRQDEATPNGFANKRSESGGQTQVKQQQEKKKQSLYKTELCTNWMLTSNCTYGNKCHFAHGITDLKSRTRPENFKTQPCCDPARDGSRRCLYGSRCNYCHPGEAIRRPVGKQYFDQKYYEQLEEDFGDNKFPYGIYV